MIVAITSATLVVGLAGPSYASVTLTGAGSSFVNPFFTSAFYAYHAIHADITVNYASVGSSTGITQFQNGTVNFGATDVPMTSDQVAQSNGPTLQVPVALGGVSIMYNLPGVSRGLNLTRSALAGIFLGTVTYWDASAIKDANPGTHLTHMKITVVHRSDGSGTTYILTDFLSKISSAWANGPGTSTSVNWPVGVGQSGSSGVAAVVQQTKGAIGYADVAYAISNHITFARVQNKSNNYISPGPNSVLSAASAFPNVNSTNFSIVNAPGIRSYPIAGYTWMLIYKTQKAADTGLALKQLALWLTSPAGQAIGKPLLYVPLPATVSKLAAKTLQQMVIPHA